MNFAWQDFLTLAAEWHNAPTPERYADAYYHSVISRAYYAVFHTAFDLAAELGLKSSRSAGDHFQLRRFFEGRGRLAGRLSFVLRTLYDLRIEADYAINPRNMVTSHPQQAAKEALNAANEAMQLIGYLQAKK